MHFKMYLSLQWLSWRLSKGCWKFSVTCLFRNHSKCWFGAQESYYYTYTIHYIIFRILWRTENQHLFKMDIYFVTLKISLLTVTFDHFNASLLTKSINLFKKLLFGSVNLYMYESLSVCLQGCGWSSSRCTISLRSGQRRGFKLPLQLWPWHPTEGKRLKQ